MTVGKTTLNSLPEESMLSKSHLLEEKLRRSMQRSQFGPQVDSLKISAPAYGFGTQHRFARSATAQLTSREAERANYGANGPGPGTYALPSCLGAQAASLNRSASNFSFGSFERFRERNRRALPAPGAYDTSKSVGEQPVSTKPTNPSFRFGTALRSTKVSLSKDHLDSLYGVDSPGPAIYTIASNIGDPGPNARLFSNTNGFGSAERMNSGVSKGGVLRVTPGPGDYMTGSALGIQTASTKRTLPSFGFSNCSRQQATKACMGKQTEMALLGQESPGPAAISAKTSVGLQPDSGKRTFPMWGFGSDQRFHRNRNSNFPGPGSYKN